MENRYISTGFLTSVLDETNCLVSRFSRFVPDLSPEKEVEDWWCPGLRGPQWRTELFIPFPEIKLKFFSNSSNSKLFCTLHSPNLPEVG